MRIVIASGKGGTGKTSLAVALAEAMPAPLTLADCDVEEPNAHLFLEDFKTSRKTPVVQPIPHVNPEACTGCGECSRICQFNAIIALGGAKAMVFPDMCHGCGGCTLVCPAKAITEISYSIGEIEQGSGENGKILITGRLDVGQAMAPPVIRKVLEKAYVGSGNVLVDAPPGTSCSFVTSVKSADYAVFVTEATPFGLHDLSLAVETIRELTVPFGVVVNRSDSEENLVTRYCEKENIPVLLQIKTSRRIAEFYSRGESMIKAQPELREKLTEMVRTIEISLNRGKV
jgi:MinD superfamily P-loop ATPase